MASKIIVDQLEKTGGALTALTLPVANATANQILKNDGAGALSWATTASAGFHQVIVKTSSDATYSPDTDVTKIVVHIQGGGGGSADTTGTGTASGSGGGYAMKQLTVTSSYVINCQVGVGGNNATTTGTAGTASSVAYVSGGSAFATITANGGGGGGLTTVTVPGGTASGGDLNIQGGWGSLETAYGAGGGNSWFGYGGVTLAAGNPRAQDGVGYGSGGSSAVAGSGIGADGTAGIIVIYEYK
jgi:hypothetical protein